MRKDRKNLEQYIPDIVVTAIEGGISYWACVDNDTDDWHDCVNNVTLNMAHGKPVTTADVFVELLMTGKSVTLYDVDDPDDVWDLTLEKLIAGIEQFEREEEISIEDRIDDGAFDSDDADRIVQYALFGELLFC